MLRQVAGRAFSGFSTRAQADRRAGANDGQLAADLIANLPDGIEYIIIEPYDGIRQQQQRRLGDQVKWVSSIAELDGGISGRFICNELLDAMPVPRVRRVDGAWHEIHVDASFEEITLPIGAPALLEELTNSIGHRELPDGYTTEVHTQAVAWIRELVRHMRSGASATIIDYGHEADDYYADTRDDGTLRGYRGHRQVTRYLEHIGETDLTASVNFTRLAELAGAPPAIDQHHYLIQAAKPWLAEIESKGAAPDADTQKLLRQFNTLVHPGLMGRSFKVLEFAR